MEEMDQKEGYEQIKKRPLVKRDDSIKQADTKDSYIWAVLARCSDSHASVMRLFNRDT